jgi:dienelactone hydrolase
MSRTRIAALAGLAFAAAVCVQSAAAAPQRVALRVVRFVDQGRVARFADGRSGPRVLVTYVRYPAGRRGPLPLVVFAHGFDTTPGVYAPLLEAWARAGYVVAAPVFPVENAHAPGGASETDLINEPSDMSFVISRLVAASADPGSPLAGLVDPRHIAVAGQSDGAEAALSAAYDGRFADRRVDAAVILSGAEMGGRTTWFPPGSPPLLAVQGSADTINPARYTAQFFRPAPRPKFLLTLEGAGHLPPYTTDAAQLAVVERVTIAFLDGFLKTGPRTIALEPADGGHVRLTSDP